MIKVKKDFFIALIFEIIFTLFGYALTLITAQTLLRIIPAVVEMPKTPLWQILLSFAVGTAIIILALKFVKRPVFFHGIFSLALFLGWQTILGTYLPLIPSLIIAVMILIGRYAYPKVWVQNCVLLGGISGLAVGLGLTLRWQTVIILLTLIAIYDIIAVYKTKHMVKMAKGLIRHRVFPALIVPGRSRGLGCEIKEVRTGKEFMFLGSGDFAFPWLLCVSALPLGLGPAFVCALGGFLGIILSFLLFNLQKEKKPIPAMPPIFLLSVLGFLIGYLIF